MMPCSKTFVYVKFTWRKPCILKLGQPKYRKIKYGFSLEVNDAREIYSHVYA